jgi:hypothetical protein
MFSWLKKLLPKKEVWRLVHTLSVQVSITAKISRKEETGEVYFHLMESNFGNRKYSVGASTSGLNRLEDDVKHLRVFHDTVFPWLHGRYVTGIPSYNDVDALDVQKKLSE